MTAAQALLEIPPEVPAVAVEGPMHAPIPVVAVNQFMGASGLPSTCWISVIARSGI